MERTVDSIGSSPAGPEAPRRPTPGQRLLRVVVPPLAAGLIAGTWLTSRVTFIRRDVALRAAAGGQRYVMAFWHSRLYFMRYAHAGGPLAALISSHQDGELIARTMAWFGHEAARGSSTRGGDRALREAIRFARAGGSLAITPDGPKGPARRAKPGVVELARATGLPILPISLACSRSWVLRSWDRFEVPQPFGRVAIAYGELLTCPREAGTEAREDLRRTLERRLDELTNEARAAVGLAPWPPAEDPA